MSPKEAPGKKQLAVILSAGLVERAKNVVYGTPGVTLAGLVAEGLLKAVERRERANGGPFKARRKDLSPGRPVTSQNNRKKREPL